MRLRAYQFGADFSAPAAPKAAPPPPMHSEEELAARVEAARAEAWEKGFSEGFDGGRAAAFDASAGNLNKQMKRLADAVEAIVAREDTCYADLHRQGARLLTAIFEKLSQRLSAAETRRSVETVVKRALHAARAGRKLTLHASQDGAARLKKAFSPAVAGFIESGRIALAVDPALEGDAVRVEWATGSVAFDPGARDAQVRAILDSINDALETPGDGQTHKGQ